MLTNKYGQKITDKHTKDFNGCGCAYCKCASADTKNKLKEKSADLEIKKQNYLEDKYDEWDNIVYEEDHYLDELSNSIMCENQIPQGQHNDTADELTKLIENELSKS